MATHRWIGRQGNDFGLAASWSSGTAPSGWGTGDTVIFAEDSQFSTTGDLSHPTIDVNLIFIGEQFTGNVGEVGNPLIISANRIVHQGKGTLYFDNSSGVIGSSPDTTDELIIAHTGDRAALAASIKGGKITTIAVARGRVDILDTEATTLLVLSHVDSRRGDADVTLFTTSTAIATLSAAGGRLVMLGASDITTLHIAQASLRNESTALASSTLRIYSGLVEWNSAVTLVRVELYGGTLDLTGSTEAKTITLLWQFPNTNFEYLPDLTTFTRVDMDGLLASEG